MSSCMATRVVVMIYLIGKTNWMHKMDKPVVRRTWCSLPFVGKQLLLPQNHPFGISERISFSLFYPSARLGWVANRPNVKSATEALTPRELKLGHVSSVEIDSRTGVRKLVVVWDEFGKEELGEYSSGIIWLRWISWNSFSILYPDISVQ